VLTNAAGCDSTVTLDLTINNSNAATDVIVAVNEYTWIDGVTYTASNNTANQVLTNVAGCDSTVTLDLTIITINVSVTQSGDVLTAVMTGVTYQWLNCPAMAVIPGATSQSYTAITNGSYAVEISNNGYSDTSICYSVLEVGIIDNSFNNELLLYPNPTNGNITIDFGEYIGIVTISIMDISGKLIQSDNYSGSQLLNLEIEFPAGVYLVKIESRDKKALIRLIKE
jgi:hypothetical protein